MEVHKTITIAAINGWLSILGIQSAAEKVRADIIGHPDYPSLFAVNQVLKRHGVANTPVEATAEYLDELPPPFIAYMNLPPNGNDFALVTRVHNGTVQFTNRKGKPETITRDEFITRWRNVAVIKDAAAPPHVVAAPAAAQKPPPKPPPHTTLAAIAVAIIIAGISTLISAAPLITLPWIFLKIIGLAVTVLLLLYEINNQNETVKQFCSASKTVNCEAVLQSKGAKIAGLGWSEAGFAYFAGTLLYGLFFSGILNAYAPLAILSVAALPYTFYSIYYQYKVVKQWCMLCLVVQGVILAEGLFALFTVLLPQQTILFATDTLPFYGLLVALIALPLIIWLVLKPLLKQASQHDNWKYAYMRLQNNPDVFDAMLRRQAAAPEGYEDYSILIGNANAENELLKICSPYCGPCATVHPLLEEIVAQNSNVKLRVMFIGTNHENDKVGKAARHFINIYFEKGEKAAQAAMHYWYSNKEKNLEEFFSKHPANNDVRTDKIKDAMNSWQDKAEITHTPTIYVNGYRLPKMYDVKDLKWIL